MAEGAAVHRVVGTAGHIDHGKTSLVRALTGVDTDRLPEERRRGISIELGFARWAIDDDVHASIVDVPGHERFVRTMVAGAAGLDAVLLVVAADDGVMPQTREHLAVCELLGVERGLVVLTKADLVDEELLALARDDVRAATRGSFLEGAPILACSALTGAGIEEVRAATLRLLRDAPARSSEGPAFLPIDRVFTRAGFGTVVTGTLLGGRLARGDEIDVLPGPRARALRGLVARGLEVHGRAAEEVPAGTRVALNLRGAERDEIRRGDVVVAAGSRAATSSLLVELRLLAAAPPLKDGDEVALHLGGTSVLARTTLLGARVLEGGAGFARFSMREPLVAFAEQRLVLRKPGAHGQGTVGGGRVLDPHPDGGRGAHARLQNLAPILADAPSVRERALALVRAGRGAGLREAELEERSPPGSDVRGALAELAREGAVLLLDEGERRWVDARAAGELEQRVLALVDELHRERPLLLGMSANELASRVPPPVQRLVEHAIARLAREGALVVEAGLVRRAEHRPKGAAAGALDRLERVYAAAGLTPPLDEEARKELRLEAKAFRDALTELKRRGRVRRVGDLHFHASALDDLTLRVTRHFDGRAELSPGDLKRLAGNVSRKFAIPLLEWLDAQGVTRRRGDVRVRGRA